MEWKCGCHDYDKIAGMNQSWVAITERHRRGGEEWIDNDD